MYVIQSPVNDTMSCMWYNVMYVIQYHVLIQCHVKTRPCLLACQSAFTSSSFLFSSLIGAYALNQLTLSFCWLVHDCFEQLTLVLASPSHMITSHRSGLLSLLCQAATQSRYLSQLWYAATQSRYLSILCHAATQSIYLSLLCHAATQSRYLSLCLPLVIVFIKFASCH